MSEQQGYSNSQRAVAKRGLRGRLFEENDGHCFYCGGVVNEEGYHQTRDWLLLKPSFMVAEHKTPVIRGGGNTPDNLVCSCQDCNNSKGTFTLDEFRFLIALRKGDLDYRFPFEPLPDAARDWLICHSPAHERELHVHNLPTAAVAYGLRNARARGPKRRSS